MKITVKVESELQSNRFFKKTLRRTVEEASAEIQEDPPCIVGDEPRQLLIENTAITLLRALKQK